MTMTMTKKSKVLSLSSPLSELGLSTKDRNALSCSACRL